MNRQNARPVPPVELHGKLVAWNHAGTEIVASGDTFAEVKAKALAAGEKRPRYERIPPADAHFIGDLTSTGVTDAGLAHLSTLPSLYDLYLAHTNVTVEGVDKLQQELPDRRVHRR